MPVALTVCLHACTQHMGKGMSKGMMGLKRTILLLMSLVE